MAAHNELGKWGEELAARYLEGKGFKILFRDWRYGHRDLDLVALKEEEELLLVVEVKTRRDERFADASQAVTPQKIRSVALAVNAFVKAYQVRSRVRFDIIIIVGKDPQTAEISHVEDVPLM